MLDNERETWGKCGCEDHPVEITRVVGDNHARDIRQRGCPAYADWAADRDEEGSSEPTGYVATPRTPRRYHQEHECRNHGDYQSAPRVDTVRDISQRTSFCGVNHSYVKSLRLRTRTRLSRWRLFCDKCRFMLMVSRICDAGHAACRGPNAYSPGSGKQTKEAEARRGNALNYIVFSGVLVRTGKCRQPPTFQQWTRVVATKPPEHENDIEWPIIFYIPIHP